MAITVDQTNIGTLASAAGTNMAFNTTATVAVGGMIVILMHRFHSGGGGVYTGTGGGLSWSLGHSMTTGNIGIYLFYAFAPAGLASATSIGVNGSVGSNDYTACAASYLGVKTSSPVTGINGATGPGAPWTSGAVDLNNGDLLIGGAGGDGTLRTSTTDPPGNERIEFNSGTTSGSITLADKQISADGPDSLDGDWSGALTYVGLGVGFSPAASADNTMKGATAGMFGEELVGTMWF